MSTVNPVVTTLLQSLAGLPDICLVVGAHEVACEAFVDPGGMDFRVEGAWVTMENGPWHIHLDATKVHKITFVVTPDTAHDSTQLSYSVRFFAADGKALLRAFFLGMYDAERALRPERVQQYEALRAQGGGQDVILCGS